MSMHDDMPGGVPQNPFDQPKVVLRHFEQPIAIRELLHSTLDRLLDEMIKLQESCGVVAVTCLDTEAENVMGGRTLVLALDFDPASHEYEGLDDMPDLEKD